MLYVINDQVLEGPSGLDILAIEEAWVRTVIGKPADSIAWASNTMAYLINRHKLNTEMFVDYLVIMFGMVKRDLVTIVKTQVP